MHKDTVYLDSINPTHIAAGPVSITGVFLRGGCDPYLLEKPPEEEKEKILQAIDRTFELPGNDLVQYFLWPTKLNRKNSEELILLKAEVICARLFYRSYVLPKRYVRRTSVIPSSTNRPLHLEQELSVGCYIAWWINKIRRENCFTNHYQNIYKNYKLEENLGIRNAQHLELILKHGPVLDFHLDSTIDYLPRYVLLQIKNLTRGYESKGYTTPWWWNSIRPNQAFLPTTELYQKLAYLFKENQHPKNFKEFLESNNPFPQQRALTETDQKELRKRAYKKRITAVETKKVKHERIQKYRKIRRTARDMG